MNGKNKMHFAVVIGFLYSLPEPIDAVEHPIHRTFDEAHTTKKNCQQLFSKCQESVWNSKYMY